MAATPPGGWAPRLHAVMRIVFALMFMQHGAQKLFGLLGRESVPLVSLLGLAGVLELGGGLLLLAGLFTRPVAFVLSGMMAVAYFMQHAPQGFWPVNNGGELAVLYCFAFLFLAAAGAGPLSVDAARAREPAAGSGTA